MNAIGSKQPSNLVLALAAALVAALTVGAWQAVAAHQVTADRDQTRVQLRAAVDGATAEREALAAAKDLIHQITTYSWQEGEHDFAWVSRLDGAELKEQIAPNVPKLQEAIVGGKVTAQGEILDAMARAVDATSVEVVAFVDQAITDETSKGISIEEQRVSMSMRLVDGTWLIDRLDLLTGTNGAGAEQ